MVDAAEVIEEIYRVTALVGHRFMEIRGASFRTSQGPFAVLRLTFSPTGTELSDASIVYGAAELWSTHLSLEASRAALSEWASTGVLAGRDVGVPRWPAVPHRTLRPSRRAEWPVWECEIGLGGNRADWSLDPYSPLLAHGRPPYRSKYEAVAHWVWGQTLDPHGQVRDNWNVPHAYIQIPDVRARLRPPDWRPGAVTLEVEGRARLDDVEVQVRVVHMDGRPEHCFKPADAPFEVELAKDAARIAVYVILPDGELAAQFEPERFGAAYFGGGDPSLAELAAQDIPLGENDQVEFKPFIKPGDSKEFQIVKTVVAFANTAGGRLYIGVTDECEPEGAVALCRAMKSEISESESKIVAWLQKLVRESVKPTPTHTARVVEYLGAPVLVVQVETGPERPYSTQNHDMFVRKGASNVKPDPRTELPKAQATASARIFG